MTDTTSQSFNIEVEHNNLIHLTLGNINSAEKLQDLREWTEKVRTTVRNLYEKTGKKVIITTDISNLNKYNPEAFAILTDLMKDNEAYVLKSATFGGSKYIIFAQDILRSFSERKNFKAFKTKEEALAWLTSQ